MTKYTNLGSTILYRSRLGSVLSPILRVHFSIFRTQYYTELYLPFFDSDIPDHGHLYHSHIRTDDALDIRNLIKETHL